LPDPRRHSNLRAAWVIAKREFVERVRSKWFVVMTVLWPILLVGMIVIPALLGGRGTAGSKVQIIDHSGVLGEDMKTVLALGEPFGLEWKTELVDPKTPEPVLLHRIASNEINGYIVIPQGAVTGESIVYNGDNASNQSVKISLLRVVNAVVMKKRAQDLNLDQTQLAMLLTPIDVTAKHTTGEEEGRSGMIVFVIGYFLAFTIYIVITLYGVAVMRSIVTEKSNKVVELMVAATNPRAMMSGKIAGVGAAGLAQIAIWFVISALAISHKEQLLSLFGAEQKQILDLPTITIAQMAVTLLCFVLGYLFYSAMYAAVGAMVSSEQDTQQAQLPITFLLMIGMFAMLAVFNDPRGSTTQTLTLIPFWSPMLMPLRYFLGGATLGQVLLSLGILTVSTYLVARAAAKIYRVGILMYGKRPSLRDLVRWLRY